MSERTQTKQTSGLSQKDERGIDIALQLRAIDRGEEPRYVLTESGDEFDQYSWLKAELEHLQN